MIQGGVSNVVKHSRADRAAVRVKRRAAEVEAEVSDNGRGFLIENQPHPDKTGGFGLKGLSERVRMLGGSHLVHSALGKGTTISVRIRAEGETGRKGEEEIGRKGERE